MWNNCVKQGYIQGLVNRYPIFSFSYLHWAVFAITWAQVVAVALTDLLPVVPEIRACIFSLALSMAFLLELILAALEVRADEPWEQADMASPAASWYFLHLPKAFFKYRSSILGKIYFRV